jgi:hypothetical protein
VDPRLKDLILGLLVQDPLQRLGCLANGVKDVCEHQAYQQAAAADGVGDGDDDDDDHKAFDWEAMKRFEMKAPWVPDLSGGAKDVSNFDDIYDDEEEDIVPFDGDAMFDF